MKNNWSVPNIGKYVSADLVREEYLDEEVVILLQGNNMFGNRVYSYVKLYGKALREMFDKMQKGQNFKPSDFGTVIAAGTGEPPKELQDEMKEQYNLQDVPFPQQAVSVNNLQPKFFSEE